MKIVLLGDSVFDNKAYVGEGELDTIGRLREALPGHECVLLAVDGSVTEDVVEYQIPAIPAGTDVVFVSSGGNDALRHADILDQGLSLDALQLVHDAQQDFRRAYEEMILRLKSFGKPFAAFTIYSGCFPEESVQRVATVAISIFNDVIYRAARAHGVRTIEIRDLFTVREDYANPIEPSTRGSRKIAEAIKRTLTRKS